MYSVTLHPLSLEGNQAPMRTDNEKAFAEPLDKSDPLLAFGGAATATIESC